MNLNRAHVHELFTPGAAITARASGAITLGSFLAVTAGSDSEHPTVTIAAPGTRPFGIAATNTEDGDLVLVQRGNGRCFRVPATTGIAAGANLEVGPNGTPVTATTGTVVAQALHASTADHVDLTLV